MKENVMLKHAPIVEAVLQVNLALPSPWDKQQAEKFVKAKLIGFSFESEMIQEKVDVVRKNPVEKPDKIAHSQCWGANRYIKDGTKIVVVYPSAIAYSRLPPYPNVREGFYKEAYEVIAAYMGQFLVPPVVTRIGLRYINRLKLDIETENLSDLLCNIPGLVQGFCENERKGFLYQESYQRKIVGVGVPANAMVTRVFPVAGTANPNEWEIVLDIDSFIQPQIELELGKLKEIVHGLREFKNNLFFGALTKEAIERYK